MNACRWWETSWISKTWLYPLLDLTNESEETLMKWPLTRVLDRLQYKAEYDKEKGFYEWYPYKDMDADNEGPRHDRRGDRTASTLARGRKDKGTYTWAEMEAMGITGPFEYEMIHLPKLGDDKWNTYGFARM